MDAHAEREKIAEEIRELERILDPGSSRTAAEIAGSSLDSDSDADSPCNEDSDATGPLISEERWAEASNDEDDAKEKALPEDPETCLQLNMVYQEVIQEKLAELSLLLAQNREQQEELAWDLAGSKGPRVKDGRSLPPNTYIGHFMKPYFKDRVTGVGPPANEDTREKAAQGIKAFEELLVTKWKSWEKTLLRKSVVSGRLQRLLQPKLLKLEYLRQKQSRVSGEVERQVLEKQAQEAEREVQEINQLPEDALLGDRLDSHDWEKIANVNFEGGRGAEEIRKFWQNCEHPSINKQEWGAQEVEQLRALAARHGCLDWQRIAEELGTHRSAFQCLQKYQQHSPALKRREWTEAEDRMLSQLVQEMRVGSHIPYRRIVYYMEGRDSMQLIYRWTKSLDPGLKKGSWAPEEDAKLLQAVAKYGEQGWFKIREEVPGRSDAQCRDRYLRRLHFSLKKGRWNPKEEEKLLELIEKHGAGHWAKIAAELPHRTGSQCLSKWKVMVRKQSRRRRRRRRPLRSVRWSSSSGDSSGDGGGGSGDNSGDSEDSEPEATPEAQEDGQTLPPAQRPVPDVGLWVPARPSAHQPWRAGAGAWPGHPAPGAKISQGGLREAGATALAAAGEACRAQTLPEAPGADPRAGASAHSADTRPPGAEDSTGEGGWLQVPLTTELQVLRANATPGRQPPKRRPCLPGCPPGACPGGGSVAGPCGQQPRRGHALQNRLLDRQLLTAVSPWVRDSVLPRPPPRPLRAHTRADGVREQLQDAHLASTPVFALFIQLFQIDTAGCMEVVSERREPPRPQQALASAPKTPGSVLPERPAREAGQRSTSHRGGGPPQACRAAAPPAQTPLPAPGGPRPKPKTVSELLREKRLREARARRAIQGPAVLPAPLLLSAPLLLRPTAPAAAGPSAAARGERPSVLPAFTLAPAGCRKQGLPELLPALPAASSPAPSPARLPGLTPALDVREGVPHAVAGTPLSVTWVLAAQGPLPVPAVLGLPGPAAPSAPKALVVALSPGLTETQADQGRQLPGPSLPGQPLATRDTGSHLAPSTGLSALLASSSRSPAEADTDTDCAPGGPSCPGGIGAPAAPRMSSQAARLPEHPPTQAPCSSEGPPGCSSSPGSGPGEAAGAPQEPLGPERLPPAQPGPEKGALDLGLLSRESEASVRDWLRAQRGVCVPPLGRRLPYQPPALCSLRALAGLLLQKKALEGRAGSLAPGGAAGTPPAAPGWVRAQLQESPAYLQLKARFLAAFALPALLATLPPRGVPTTLSATPRVASESEDEGPERSASPAPAQGVPAAAGGAAPLSPDGADHPDVLRTRHARHTRRRSRPE